MRRDRVSPRRWRHRLSLLLLLAGLAGLAGALLPAGPARGAVPVLVVDGRGWGHGVGMAQDGAYWMGRDGATVGDILGYFYPGTELTRAGGPVRVAVLTAASDGVVVGFPGGGELRSPAAGPQSPGFPVVLGPGGQAVIRHDGTYRVAAEGTVHAQAQGPAVTTQLPPVPGAPPPPTAEPPPPTAPPGPTTTSTTAAPGAPADPAPSGEVTSNEPIWAVPADDGTVSVPARRARYRGVVEATAAGVPLRLVNQVDVEQYLRGMGEVRDASWPAASLQAQAIAARTYALRAMAANNEICDTQRCQVYLGQQAEYAAMDRAVTDTVGQVLTYRGAFASTVYSANGAGHSATPQEGFGITNAVPYLRAAPYVSRSDDPWEVRIGLGDLAARLGYPGALAQVEVAATGPSGRATAVRLTGDAGERTVPALTLARAAGLRSTMWQLGVELADEAPPPPEEGERIQALPDEVRQALQHDRQLASTFARPPRARVGVPGLSLGDQATATAATDGDHDSSAPGWAAPVLVGLALVAGAAGLATLVRDSGRPRRDGR